MRKTVFANNEYYHIYNRGVDKRKIFSDQSDWKRFLRSMIEFNTEDLIGSIYASSFLSEKPGAKKKKLVNIICYCLNSNHYHFILEQLVERGIEKFMHKLGLGYTNYFNAKWHRSGSLFQGPFKAVRVDNNAYLLHLSAYVNLNFKIHPLRNLVPKWGSSWNEYTNAWPGKELCVKNIILDQFKNQKEYKEFAENSLIEIRKRKNMLKDLENLLLE